MIGQHVQMLTGDDKAADGRPVNVVVNLKTRRLGPVPAFSAP
jgi:hypothetical protein